MTSKDDMRSDAMAEESLRFRSRASSESVRSERNFAAPASNDPDQLTPADFDDDRMSVASSTAAKCSLRHTPSSSQQKFDGGFEKECSYESSPSHSENKLDLAMVPVISDQLLYDIVNKERTIEQIDVYLFVKKSLDLLSAKTAAETKVEQLKHRCAELEAENRSIRESKVKMQVRVEQEEEYISNMLLKRIQKLKTDKEVLALKYEQEEEFLTNDLMRKLTQLEGERDELATRLSTDQNWVVNNLLVKIRKLEAEIQSNQKSLEQLRREKIDLENSLEHEQEALFNKIGKRMDQLESEKRRLQSRLDEVDAAGTAGSLGSPSNSSVNSSMIVEAPSSISSSAASLRVLSRDNSTTSGYVSAGSAPTISSDASGGVRLKPASRTASFSTDMTPASSVETSSLASLSSSAADSAPFGGNDGGVPPGSRAALRLPTVGGPWTKSGGSQRAPTGDKADGSSA